MRGSAEVKGMLKNKFGRRIAGRAAAALVCAVAAAPAFAAEKAKTSQFCASEGDLAALNARVLQTELMVAALSCDELQRYNNFISSDQSLIISRSQSLQGMFKRALGALGLDGRRRPAETGDAGPAGRPGCARLLLRRRPR